MTSDAPARNFFVYNGEHWREFATLEAATKEADAAIEHARDACDPEWPVWVTEICVFSAPPGCDYPDEDGRLVLYVKDVEIEHDADPEAAGVDYWCDYVMTEATDTDLADLHRH